MGGHSSDADDLRHAEMGGDAADLPRTYLRTSDGRITGGTRTHNWLQTDSDTDWERTLDGLLTGGLWSDLDESSYSKMGGGVAAAFHAAR